ncbi:hypothetical protein SCORR_v1c02750 [Spiroplasma corruscae]|uniref:Uncharacterized protein n=1 Tax=Spiroplasma corruscae TaxID=216934 RepID=A0A222ENH4_9MOLU|nr:hypothetical protein [Spiroplasma corruscae]ASP28049.1 hypothetical protein SCORR_v1c02750 [Spiroplasma corruscae]
MISLQTLVLDILSILGIIFVIFIPLYFYFIQGRVLNGRLHTKIDGEKLFEKLKTDLRLSRISGIDKKRLYFDYDYAATIFRGSMEYNAREVVWFFNEYYAKIYIKKSILKKAFTHILIWLIFLGVVLGGVELDALLWLFNIKSMSSDSGIVSTSILFIFATAFCGLIKYLEFNRVKRVINDEVRQINLAKKEKVWKDYKLIYFISIGTWALGFIFIFISMIVK